MRQLTDSNIGYINRKPINWALVPGKSMFDEVKDKNIDGSITNALKFTYGKIVCKENFDASKEQYVAETIKTYNRVKANDIVINGLNLNYDFVSQRVAIVKENGIITSAYIVIRPKSHINPQYINYLLKSCDNMKVLHGMGEGIRQTIKFEDIGNMPLLCPNKEEQDIVVAYLDAKCAAIDEAIERHKKIIEKLEEYQFSKISSQTSYLPLVKIGRFLTSIQTGPFGSQLHSEEYVEGGVAVINPSNIKNGNIFIDNQCTITQEKAEELSRHMLVQGDIVIARRGEMGRCAVVKNEGMICGTGCFVIKCGKKILPEYASICIRSNRSIEYLTMNAIGTTMANLNTEIIASCPIPYCEISMQEKILAEIAEITQNYQLAISKYNTIITRLEEYRKSIIYNAVTGKIDCREASK